MTIADIVSQAVSKKQASLDLERRNQKAVNELADFLDVSVPYLYKWISGERKPSLSQFGQLLVFSNYPQGFDELKSHFFPKVKK